MIILDDNDKQSIRLCCWREARGGGVVSMAAVAEVIYHRPGKPGFGHTIHDVIYGKNQFTSMSVPSDPEFKTNERTDDPSWLETPDGKAWVATALIVDNLPTAPDQTKGALYYANPKATPKGSWFEKNISGVDWKGLPGHDLLAIICSHYFFA